MDRPHIKEESMATQTAALASFAAPARTLESHENVATSNPLRLQRMSEWWRRIRERDELMRLGDRELADIGCSKTDAKAEASKWFWEA
jgi:uncharacterized protein YjiS (DUF1127 family)